MDKLLKGIGIFTAIVATIAGIVEANSVTEFSAFGFEREASFQWLLFFTWFLSGLLSGILFFAFGTVLSNQNYIIARLDVIDSNVAPTHTDSKPNYAAKQPEHSKLNLDAAKGYKMKSVD